MRRKLYKQPGLTADSLRFIGHHLFRDWNRHVIAYASWVDETLKIGAEIVEMWEVSFGALAH